MKEKKGEREGRGCKRKRIRKNKYKKETEGGRRRKNEKEQKLERK